MKTFHIGLSMAGTVSAGTYTGGTLVELNKWLMAWQKAKTTGVSLKATVKTKNYDIGDTVAFSKAEIPDHTVKIKTMSGASGGGVSAALYLFGLTSGKVEEMLRDVWTSFDVKDMLRTDDLVEGKPIDSVLNTYPINQMMEMLKNESWDDIDHASALEYIDDNLELYMTLGALEGIPYKTAASRGSGLSYGVHKTHLDYIKFNFQKKEGIPSSNLLPYAYNLMYRPGRKFGNDGNWAKLIQSAPATGAFPVGFKPRSIKRFRKEYDAKLFYLNYVYGTKNKYDNGESNKFEFDYSELKPNWKDGNPDDTFEMEYVDGGTFNREPHDLARASLIQSLGLGDHVNNDGKSANASVILIDPFPSNFDDRSLPGKKLDSIPPLFKLPGPLLGAMLDQGRFRPDWIERTLDKNYYSRFMISPVRRDASGEISDIPLAGSLFSAFSGFIHESYRKHDYKLGRYNSFQFLKQHFVVPVNNQVVDYYQKADADLKEKYEAVGWCMSRDADSEIDHCEVIPRMIEPDVENSLDSPEWPMMSRNEWEELRELALERGRELFDVALDLNWVGEHTTDPAVWRFYAKGKVKDMLASMAEELQKHDLLR